jgi:hypothetical protein
MARCWLPSSLLGGRCIHCLVAICVWSDSVRLQVKISRNFYLSKLGNSTPYLSISATGTQMII